MPLAPAALNGPVSGGSDKTYARDAASDTGVNRFLATSLAGFAKTIPVHPVTNTFAYVLRKVAGLGTEQLDEAKSTYTPT